jgi:hypothetical protein
LRKSATREGRGALAQIGLHAGSGFEGLALRDELALSVRRLLLHHTGKFRLDLLHAGLMLLQEGLHARLVLPNVATVGEATSVMRATTAASDAPTASRRAASSASNRAIAWRATLPDAPQRRFLLRVASGPSILAAGALFRSAAHFAPLVSVPHHEAEVRRGIVEGSRLPTVMARRPCCSDSDTVLSASRFAGVKCGGRGPLAGGLAQLRRFDAPQDGQLLRVLCPKPLAGVEFSLANAKTLDGFVVLYSSETIAQRSPPWPPRKLGRSADADSARLLWLRPPHDESCREVA